MFPQRFSPTLGLAGYSPQIGERVLGARARHRESREAVASSYRPPSEMPVNPILRPSRHRPRTPPSSLDEKEFKRAYRRVLKPIVGIYSACRIFSSMYSLVSSTRAVRGRQTLGVRASTINKLNMVMCTVQGVITPMPVCPSPTFSTRRSRSRRMGRV